MRQGMSPIVSDTNRMAADTAGRPAEDSTPTGGPATETPQREGALFCQSKKRCSALSRRCSSSRFRMQPQNQGRGKDYRAQYVFGLNACEASTAIASAIRAPTG